LLGNDAEPIDQHLPRALGGKDFPSIMEDRRWFAPTRPGVLAASLENQAVFRLKCHFQQAHVVLLASGNPMPALRS